MSTLNITNFYQITTVGITNITSDNLQSTNITTTALNVSNQVATNITTTTINTTGASNWSGRHYAYVIGLNSQSISAITTTLLNSYWSGATSSGISYSAGRMTIARAGFYEISACVQATPGNTFAIFFTINGDGSGQRRYGTNTTFVGNISGTLQLRANDVIDVRVYSGSGVTTDTNAFNQGYFGVTEL